MKIAIMQPYSFPYIGYFQLLNAVDTFVFYDDVSFIKKGYINRNSILVNKEKNQFVIPCKMISQNKRIDEIELSFDEKARHKLLKTIKLAYRRAPYFDSFYPILEDYFLDQSMTTISEFAIGSVKLISNFLGILTQFKQSSIEYAESINLNKTDRLIAICKKENASTYINPIGGVELYKKSDFEEHGISLKFHKSNPITYQQFDHDFVNWLSIIDVLMFNSKEEVSVMLNDYELL
ncbi:MAG: WbqC family protein [Flavobacteriaceae bacterium]|nr:WbqC family protein [Flavobacteriaceae bacterium]